MIKAIVGVIFIIALASGGLYLYKPEIIGGFVSSFSSPTTTTTAPNICPLDEQLRETIRWSASRMGDNLIVSMPVGSWEGYSLGYAHTNYGVLCYPNPIIKDPYIFHCRSGSGVGENINYAYCPADDLSLGKYLISLPENVVVSPDGTITEKSKGDFVITSLILDKRDFSVVQLTCGQIDCG